MIQNQKNISYQLSELKQTELRYHQTEKQLSTSLVIQLKWPAPLAPICLQSLFGLPLPLCLLVVLV